MAELFDQSDSHSLRLLDEKARTAEETARAALTDMQAAKRRMDTVYRIMVRLFLGASSEDGKRKEALDYLARRFRDECQVFDDANARCTDALDMRDEYAREMERQLD